MEKSHFMYKRIFLGISFVFLFLFGISPAFADTFNRNLRQGDRGIDVLNLQKFLNSNEATQISSGGPGSLGQETSYFGSKTTLAVVKFQKLYGISPAYGFVGPITRQKLEALGGPDSLVISPSSENNVSPVLDPNKATSSPSYDLVEFYSHFTDPNDLSPLLLLTSAYQVTPNSQMTVYGGHLNEKNSHIYMGQNELSTTFKSDASAIVTIPSLSPGKYDIWASNDYGSSTAKARIKIEITNNPLPKPIIRWSEPFSVTLESIIVIHGENFTPTGNSVTTGFGSVKDLASSDGKTLSFKISALSGVSKLNAVGKLAGAEVPMSFSVRNAGGSSNQTGLFYISF
jgi:peptidoglycan hydrolase-like protein with peptidoglycan-binding domain